MAVRKDIKEIISKVITQKQAAIFRAYLMEPNSAMELNTSQSNYGFTLDEAIKILMEEGEIKNPNDLIGKQVSIFRATIKSKELKDLIEAEYDIKKEESKIDPIVPITEEAGTPSHNPVLLTPNRIMFGLIDLVRGSEKVQDFEIDVFDIIPNEIKYDIDYNTQEITIKEISYDQV